MSETSPGKNTLPHRGNSDNSNNHSSHLAVERVSSNSTSTTSIWNNLFDGQASPLFSPQDGLFYSSTICSAPCSSTAISSRPSTCMAHASYAHSNQSNDTYSNLASLFSTSVTQRSSYCDISSHHTFSQSQPYQRLSSHNNNNNLGNNNFLDLQQQQRQSNFYPLPETEANQRYVQPHSADAARHLPPHHFPSADSHPHFRRTHQASFQSFVTPGSSGPGRPSFSSSSYSLGMSGPTSPPNDPGMNHPGSTALVHEQEMASHSELVIPTHPTSSFLPSEVPPILHPSPADATLATIDESDYDLQSWYSELTSFGQHLTSSGPQVATSGHALTSLGHPSTGTCLSPTLPPSISTSIMDYLQDDGKLNMAVNFTSSPPPDPPLPPPPLPPPHFTPTGSTNTNRSSQFEACIGLPSHRNHPSTLNRFSYHSYHYPISTSSSSSSSSSSVTSATSISPLSTTGGPTMNQAAQPFLCHPHCRSMNVSDSTYSHPVPLYSTRAVPHTPSTHFSTNFSHPTSSVSSSSSSSSSSSLAFSFSSTLNLPTKWVQSSSSTSRTTLATFTCCSFSTSSSSSSSSTASKHHSKVSPTPLPTKSVPFLNQALLPSTFCSTIG